MDIVVFFLVVFLVLAAVAAPRVIRHILKERYFASAEFLAHKARIAAFVAEHNEVARYIGEMRNRGTFALGASSTGSQAHLASYQNTSQWNYRRDRNVANYHAPNVHNCSLQVVRNASADPIKYLCKYFGIKADESHLAEVEKLGEDIAQLENAIHNLTLREASIAQSVSPPPFIMKHYHDEFMRHVGVELSPISVPYPVYIFEYVSAGGNSGQRSAVTLNTPTIDALVEDLSQRIRWKKSAAGQRALMTSRLREMIKSRDKHTCQSCSVSVAAEPHLLLEIDHIVPVSRGGLSTPDNLQTLCWRCNRSKSNKVFTSSTVTPGSTPPVAHSTAQSSQHQTAGTPSQPNYSRVRCFKCQHVQRVPKLQTRFTCEACGHSLTRRVSNQP
ncbi:HNH endonuclease [Mycolicibacterium sp. BiH015]|uniref:HNH endonuclease n=1 Tax=Mycolicibacterium sp. BiH015 TaxID=3018808 RepID=UPI0022E63F4E|nr:HNH endonuclease [Mycolicibacterium sp. BiH015]MDA2893410.1 HNH endonuclease [Mycolicibacterium sp. BiH015]